MKKEKSIKCVYCGEFFIAFRSDAKRCKNCHRRRRSAHQKSERGKMLKAKRHRELREQAFAGYGGECQCCGENTFEFLAIDHVNGGGRKDRENNSTYQIARRVIKENFPDDYRILCHNCNQAMGWYGFCPHQKRTA